MTRRCASLAPLAALFVLVSCGGHARQVDPGPPRESVVAATAPPPTDGGHATEATAAPTEESAACRSGRVAILENGEVSRQRPCATDDDCTTVTNPGHPAPEYAIVVHAADAIRLSVEAESLLAECGPFIHHDPSETFDVVEARCLPSGCGAERTTYH